MQMTVRFEAQLREAAGTDAVVLNLEVGTFSALLKTLETEFPDAVTRRIVNSDGFPLRSTLVFLNDEAVSHENLTDTRLHDGDVIAFYPPIAGG